MAALAERMVADGVRSLAQLDRELVEQVIGADDEMDRLALEIETKCIRILALQQPTATDLRVVGSAMMIINDLERIGDYAVDVAKITRKINKAGARSDVIDLPRMADVVRGMLRDAIEAYVHRDADRILRVCDAEDQVDGMYRELRGQIFRHMDGEMPQHVADGWLLLAVHHVERIADHTRNIAQRVSFIITGTLRPTIQNERSS